MQRQASRLQDKTLSTLTWPGQELLEGTLVLERQLLHVLRLQELGHHFRAVVT